MATSAARSPAKAPTRRREPTPAAPTSLTVEIQVPHEVIAQRAFEKFATRGYVHGFAVQDWLDAEDELKAEFRDRQ
jgi:hypothetical protein